MNDNITIASFLKHLYQKVLNEGPRSLTLDESFQFLYIISEEKKLNRQDNLVDALITCILHEAIFDDLSYQEVEECEEQPIKDFFINQNDENLNIRELERRILRESRIEVFYN